ncbi:MAG: XRE family transcriptional regulator [Proteobacteria bacterium]|nr:XRE family transcriptional regulator [Pseudomonadota bacterium]
MNSSHAVGKNLHERLAQARESAGFSRTEAAQKLDFKHYQILSAMEKGTRNVSAGELIAMARLYGRPLDYFFDADVPADPVPLWRRAAGSDVQKEQRQFLAFLESYTCLENLLGLKGRWKEILTHLDKDDFAGNGFEAAEKLGADIHRRLDLGSRPACNLLNILENTLRFKVIHLDLGEGVSGASIMDSALGVGILINAHDAPWRRNFDLAHELFHIITWKIFSHEEIGDGSRKTKPEQYADSFAASLLLPKEHLLATLKEISVNQELKLVDIIELAKEFGVSSEAVLWRLVNLKKLKKSQVEKILGDSEFRNLDRGLRRGLYEEHQPEKFPQRYVSLACRCLMEGKISRGLFAEYMEIDRSGIDDYLSAAGYAVKNYEKIAAA